MDHYYSEEQAEKLKAFIGFEPTSEFFEVPEPFKSVLPRDKWPVFKFRGMDGRVAAQVESTLGYLDRGGNYFVNAGNARLVKLKQCIRGWKNFRDSNQEEIPFALSMDEVPEELIRRIRPELQIALEKIIDKGSGLLGDELIGLKF